MEFVPIETQEDFEKACAQRVGQAEEAVRAEFADYADLKSRLENAKAENEQQAATIKGLETAAQKRAIAEEYGIPTSLADRLKGEDEEALRSDAAALAPMLKTKKTAPLRDPESGDNHRDGLRKLLAEISW